MQSTLDFWPHPANLPGPMASLAQLLANHGRILLLDAAATTVQVGLLRTDQPDLWKTAETESGTALFTGAASCLAEAGLRMNEIAAFAFCEGPGSMLGIRIAAMAIRTWQAEKPRPAYAYGSLQVIATALAAVEPAPFSVIADARRESWHCLSVDRHGAVAPLRRVPTADLATGSEPLFQPRAFRAWAPAPRPASDCPYGVGDLLGTLRHKDLFTRTAEPDAFQHEAPSYRKWSSQVHSAESAARP